MKTKNGKTPRLFQPGNAMLDGEIEKAEGGNRSLLSEWIAQELDEDTRASQSSARAAELFLQTRLFPLSEAAAPVDEGRLVQMLADFQRAHAAPHELFEMAQVVARLLDRFHYHLIADDSPSALSEALEREVDLFIQLAELDFQRIDKAVWEQVHSG